jgi:hypothetical protein
MNYSSYRAFRKHHFEELRSFCLWLANSSVQSSGDKTQGVIHQASAANSRT